jgi:hypothetical protein
MRILLTLSILLILALMASSRKFWAFRRTPTGATLFSGGWLLILIGMLLGPHGTGIIESQEVALHHPLVIFCLGWIGLIIGFQVDRRLPKIVPRWILSIALLDAGLSVFLATSISMAVFMWVLEASFWSVLPHSLLLGICSISWSPELRSLKANPAIRLQTSLLIRGGAGIGSILMVVLYTLLINSFQVAPSGEGLYGVSFRQLSLGVFAPVLIALAVGFAGPWLVKMTESDKGQFLVVLLGMICFTAGAATLMDQLPLFVAMLLGAVLVNLPKIALTRLKRVIIEGEQPMAMILMLAIGIMADPTILLAAPKLAIALIATLFITRGLLKSGLIQHVFRSNLDHQVPTPSLIGLLRSNPVSIAIAAGYTISTLGRAEGSPVIASQLLMVLIVVGMISDLTSLILTKDYQDLKFSKPPRQEVEA